MTNSEPSSAAECVLAHAVLAKDVLSILGTDDDTGLDESQVDVLRELYGFNQLAEEPPVPTWRKLIAQFSDLVIWILIFAAVVSGALGEWVDAIAILAIILLNGVIGFLQEERAERALSALHKMSAPLAKVIRSSAPKSLPARELVPGDVIEIEAGDNIPADARLLTAFSLNIQEAALTGESVPVAKDADALLKESVPLGDRRNMLYMGTIAAAGTGRAVVVRTGMQTELGKIAGMLTRHAHEPTPLQRRLAELGRVLIVICLVVVLVIFALQLLRGGELAEALLVSVSLAVAAVPEGLPAVVTVALALGLQRMVKRNALVRKLPSVETLGSVSVICSDKTGTLTRNQMTVREIATAGSRYVVSGIGYEPSGSFQCAGEESSRASAVTDPELLTALEIGAYCNHAKLVPPGRDRSGWQVIGDPTEGALVVAARKAGVDTSAKRVVFEVPFDSERKAMSVVVSTSNGNRLLYTKGAPEIVLNKCANELRDGRVVPLAPCRREAILSINADMAGRALRVLALAYRPGVPQQFAAGEDLERELVFSGLVGMIDPPRDEVKAAVVTCREAGIRPVMITGDHPATAQAIAHELGMMGDQDRAISAVELDRWSDAELVERVERIAVYARASAEHKLRIVGAWRTRGHVVAMTGDGVNDAPAVKAADIGIAMGITGTDVTKEAADMVLTDDNFASIVSAVEEGRGIFDNIQKVLQFLLSCNFGEILLMLVASLLGWPAPLLAIHLLWINLVTDGLPALALSLEPPEPGIMRRKPRRAKESILSPAIGLNIAWQGFLVGLVGLLGFALGYIAEGDAERGRAVAFCVLVYAELLRALAARSKQLTLFQLGLFTNPYLLLAIVVSGMLQLSITVVPFTQGIFAVPSHSFPEWLAIILLSLLPVTTIELGKLALACHRRKKTSLADTTVG